MTVPINVCILFGPTLLADLTDDVPEDFQPYPGYESPDGKVAKGTQEELLLWVHSADKDLCWETQWKFRNAVEGHMTVARETPTFIYRNSLDLTGFIDGTGNPEPEDQHDRGIVPDGQPGAGGSFCIAQRWVHDLDYFNGLSLEDQENTFGRTKADSTKLPTQVPTSHLAHVELREGNDRRRRHAEAGRDGAPLDAVRVPRRHGRPLLHGLLQGAGAAAGAHGGDLRHERPGPRRAHRLLDARVGLVLLRAVGRDPGRRPRVASPASSAAVRGPSGTGRGRGTTRGR